MKAFLVLLVVSIVCERAYATNALGLSAIGESGAFRLSKAISANPTNSLGAPISVVPFQDAAGVNKLLVIDSDNQYYISNDANNQDLSDAEVGTCPTYDAGQAVALGGDIYLTDAINPGVVWTLHADGSGESVAINVPAVPMGLAANHQTGKLYISTSGGIYEVDPLSSEPGRLIAHTPDGFIWAGIAFSADYQMLYASTLSMMGEPEKDSVYGFVLNNGQAIEVSHSPDMPGAYGVLAGTGCLADYLFVLTNAGIAQIDFHGVDQIIASHSDPQAVAMGFLSYDPVDGSILIPESDGVYRLNAPPCGGFASTPRFRAHALPVGHSCVANVDCSSFKCIGGTCQANGYLGTCQQNSDCVDPISNDGLFCQAASIHAVKERHGKKHNHPDVDFDAGRRAPVYGVCEINACVSAHGGCDQDATCTPTGDAQRVCSCNTGFFGNGFESRCINPCTALPPPCDMVARCVSLSATTFRCECPSPATFGVGTLASPCMPSPCALDINGKNACGNGVCTPTSLTDYDCQCLPGNFRQLAPLNGDDYTVDYPQCVNDRCSVNNGDCARNALCTPTGMGQRTCACAPGFLPQGVVDPPACTPAACVSLSPGIFPLADAHAAVGSCTAKTAGERCRLGCLAGYKAVVAGKSYPAITAVCGVVNGVLIYSFTPFACVADPNSRGIGDGKDGDSKGGINVRNPWYCGVTQIVPCAPSAPWVLSKDTVYRRLILNWVALGTSTGGDIVSELHIHITPDGNQGAGFSTPSVPEPMFATQITIDNLLPGHTYVFRLIASTQNGLATGLPLEITF